MNKIEAMKNDKSAGVRKRVQKALKSIKERDCLEQPQRLSD